MSNTRTVKSPGVFAADASTTIPPTPSIGVAYRDTTTTSPETQAGWPYATAVASETFNQIMHELSGMLAILDAQGLLGWCNAVDYGTSAYVLGSDGQLYRSIAASGPSSAPQDPTTAPTYWTRFGAVAASTAEVSAGLATDKFVSPATLLAGLLGGGLPSSSGWAAFPIVFGGSKVNIIVQWGRVAGLVTDVAVPISLPTTFPNAHLAAFASVDQVGNVGGSYSAYAHNTSTSVVTVTGDVSSGSASGLAAFWFSIGF